MARDFLALILASMLALASPAMGQTFPPDDHHLIRLRSTAALSEIHGAFPQHLGFTAADIIVVRGQMSRACIADGNPSFGGCDRYPLDPHVQLTATLGSLAWTLADATYLPLVGEPRFFPTSPWEGHVEFRDGVFQKADGPSSPS